MWLLRSLIRDFREHAFGLSMIAIMLLVIFSLDYCRTQQVENNERNDHSEVSR